MKQIKHSAALDTKYIYIAMAKYKTLPFTLPKVLLHN